MKIIAVLIGFLGVMSATVGAYAVFFGEDSIEKKLENGLVLEVDARTGYITHIELSTDFLREAFNLEENQINLQILEAVREEVEYGSMVYQQFRESGLLEVIEPVFEMGEVSSQYALLVDAQSGRVLMDMNGEQKMYPASMTKVMTTLVAIEALEETNALNELITIDADMFYYLNKQHASMAGFMPGEQVPAIELLYGIMLPSGGESTFAIAREIAGTEEAFVELMNQKASDIGLTQTNFENPTGLHHPNHYTTAEEMVILLRYALNNELFRELFTSTTHTTASGLRLDSTLFSPIPRTEVTNGEIIGGRTGFTLEAGRCLISLAVINGREYILVTGAAENTFENRIQHLLDAIFIFDQV